MRLWFSSETLGVGEREGRAAGMDEVDMGEELFFWVCDDEVAGKGTEICMKGEERRV